MTADTSSYEVLSSSLAYEGERLTVRVDTLSMPDDSRASREVVVVDDAVAVVAIDDRQRVCLLGQYRHPFGERVLGLAKDPGVDRNIPFNELRVGTQRAKQN